MRQKGILDMLKTLVGFIGAESKQNLMDHVMTGHYVATLLSSQNMLHPQHLLHIHTPPSQTQK